MNAVVYYSNTGQSQAVAEYIAQKVGYPIFDISCATECRYDNLVLVFPVHCQNIPEAVMAFLRRVKAQNLIPIVTYGRICHGNVLFELQNEYKFRIIAAAYLPTKHAYLDETVIADYSRLDEIIPKINNPSVVVIPKSYKNLFAGFFPKSRSQMGVRIIRTSACNGCNVCSDNCIYHAIENGKVDRRCIRCLRCVAHCPENALEIRLALPLKLYLAKNKMPNPEIFV